MIRFFTTLSLIIAINVVHAQNLADILRLLPREYMSEVNVDSLIENKNYYPPSNDDESAVVFSLVKFDEDKGNIRIEMTSTTGQSGFVRIEVKRIKLKKDKYLVIYSNVSGAPIVFRQNEFETFYYQKGILTKTSEEIFPGNLGLKDFIKPNTPDSVITKYSGYSNHCYELIYYGDNVCYILHENFDPFNIDKTWLLGNTIEFILTKDRVKKLHPKFKD